MIHALQVVLTVSAVAALLLACVVRAARPGHLLAVLGKAWQWWLIYRPGWLPGKPSGDCPYCTAFYLPGLPLALLTGVCLLHGPASWLAALVPPFTAFLFERLISR